MISFIYTLHSHLRWLVVLMLVVALVKLGVTWARGGSFGGADRGLTAAAVGFIDLQVLLGLILLIGLDVGMPRYQIEHGATMVLALVAAHMTAKWKKEQGPDRARKTFIALVIAAVLIAVGVMRLPGGWTRGL